MRDVFGAFFFLNFGLALDIGEFGGVVVPVIVAVVLTLVVNTLGGQLIAWLNRLTPAEGFNVSGMLQNRGEFALILATLATAAGLDPAADAVRRPLRADHGDRRTGARGQLGEGRARASSGRRRRKAARATTAQRDRDFALAEAAMSGAPGDDTAALEVAASESPFEFAEVSGGVEDEVASSAEERLAEQAGAQSDVPSRRGRCANPTRSTEPWHPGSGPSPCRPRWIAALLLCLGIAAGFAALGQWQLSRSVENADVADAPDTEVAVPLASIAEPQTEVTQPQLGRRVTVDGRRSSRRLHGAERAQQRRAPTGAGWSGTCVDRRRRRRLAVALGWAPTRMPRPPRRGARHRRPRRFDGPLPAERGADRVRLRGGRAQRALGRRAHQPLAGAPTASTAATWCSTRRRPASRRSTPRPVARGRAQLAQHVLRPRVGDLRGLRDLPLVPPGAGRVGAGGSEERDRRIGACPSRPPGRHLRGSGRRSRLPGLRDHHRNLPAAARADDGAAATASASTSSSAARTASSPSRRRTSSRPSTSRPAS